MTICPHSSVRMYGLTDYFHIPLQFTRHKVDLSFMIRISSDWYSPVLRRLVVFFHLFLIVSSVIWAQQDLSLSLSEVAVQIREQVDIGNIRKDVARLSSLSTRVTGYPQAASASKYVFDRFVEIGLEDVEGRDFPITVPVDKGNSQLEIISSNTIFKLSPLWPNLVRTSLISDGIKHRVTMGETLDQIAESYQIDRQEIVSHNPFLQRDGNDQTLVEGNEIFIPTGGLTAPIIDGGTCDLKQFNGTDVGGFWYKVKSTDTIEFVARQNGVGAASITDDILNRHLQKNEDSIDNNVNGEVDEYGEIPLLSEISEWATDGIDNNGNGLIDEKVGAERNGLDDDGDGLVDEDDEFVAADESHIFIPRGSIVLADFNSGTKWINGSMLGAKAVIFIEPDVTMRGEAENKFLTVPANIPRFWIGKSDGEQLKRLISSANQSGDNLEVRLSGKIKWEKKVGQNIRGFLPGSDPQLKDEMIVISAYYDSMSVVPSMAPGAEPTSGIATLMELARIFRSQAFRPGRSVLFVATDAHFQGLSGMRAFMDGIGQDVIGEIEDSAGTPTMHGLRRGIDTDLHELEELGRKIVLSIDRNVLVDLPSDFYGHIHQINSDLNSLVITLDGLVETQNKISLLTKAQRDYKEKQKKKTQSTKKREKQDFTKEEESLLKANSAKFKKEAEQTVQFLRDIIFRLDQLQKVAIDKCRIAQQELLSNVALPMAHLDLWALDQLTEDLRSKQIGGKYSQTPDSSYIQPTEISKGKFVLNEPANFTGNPDHIEMLSTYLHDWEFEDPRKFTLQYSQEKLLDRHLAFRDLQKMKSARSTIHNGTKSRGNYIEQEKQILKQVANEINKSNQSATAVENFKNVINRLRGEPLAEPKSDVIESYLTVESRKRLRDLKTDIQRKLDEKSSEAEKGTSTASIEVAIIDLTKDKQAILEVGMRNAGVEKQRVTDLIDGHDQLERLYLKEEELVLRNYLEDSEVDSALEARLQIGAYLTESRLLSYIKERASNDIIELKALQNQINNLNSGLPDETKDLLRNNMMTLRNARFRNIQTKAERLFRISKLEYRRKIKAIEQAISLQDTFNRFYTSLFISVDLSSQSDKFGVFNKGWFYDQQPEHVLRREFASIGNRLTEYANQADFGERIDKLWQFTDDQIQRGITTNQWSVSSGIKPKEKLEGKTLESLISNHYDTLTGLGGVSRLMRMQFEQMKARGEPSEDMLKDMDYIRKEVERFVRNDIRSARKTRKNLIRRTNKLKSQLALRGEDPAQLTTDEIDDIKTLIGMVGLGGDSNFVNAISASGGKTWRTHIPGKIAFDSEVATLTGKTGIAFATVDDRRVLTDTPLDTIDRMDLKKDGNLHAQIKSLASILVQALRDPSMPTAARVDNFYCSLIGNVVEFDARESSVPDKPVPQPILTIRRKHKSMMGVRGDLFIMGDNRGAYEVTGLAMEGRATNRIGGAQEIEAYVLDNESGDITYAPDLGNYGAKLLPNKIPIDRRRRGAPIVVFKCVSTTIYDLVDQRYLRTLRNLDVYDAATDSAPEKFGVSKPWQQEGVSATEPIALVYSEPNSRLKLGMSYGQIGKRLLLIKAGQSGTKNPTLYTGEGFVVRENGSIRTTPYVVVRDMWWLDENRSRLYKRFGISSERLDQLHHYAHENLSQAEIALKKGAYDSAMQLARAAWGYESLAYPDVKKTGNDVVNGVMFYLALLLPFSYFMERLIFGFPSVNKQLVGTFAIFVVSFAFLAMVHPAFQITTTPVIILIAFIVLALSVIVIAIIIRKFEEQLEKIKQESSKVYKADVGRLSASAAAFSLGISNMRKRSGRTILTSATLVILTFTVISFTSVRTFVRPNRTTLGTVTPKYNGMLIRDQYWRALEEPVYTSISNDLTYKNIEVSDLISRKEQEIRRLKGLSDQGKNKSIQSDLQARISKLTQQVGKLETLADVNSELSSVNDEIQKSQTQITVRNVVAPRAWYQTSGTGDQSFVQLTRIENPIDPLPPLNSGNKPKQYQANMLVGMSHEEPDITSIDSHLIYGKWFLPEDDSEWSTDWPNACVLPKGMADILGITESDMGKATVQVGGAKYTVTGVLGLTFKDLKDNDGEELTPVDYQLMNQQQSRGGQGDETLEGELQKYIHLTPDSIAILPYEVIMNMGGKLQSVAVNMSRNEYDLAELEPIEKLDLIMVPLMNRVALDLFVGRGDEAYLYSSIGMTSFSGMTNLFVPILIASLIVLNTMLGAVYERVREIGIYSSVGLAPVHIAFLFLAEACVYAVLGAVIGYLFGQAVATVLVKFGLMGGLTLNYSSMSTVIATIVVMIVVMASTLYPAIKAGRMAVPDIERKWKLPEPDGDLWHFNLPFTVLAEEALGLNIFMKDYFDAHADESASDFYTDQVSFNQVAIDDETEYSCSMMVWLAPYDLGVSQVIRLVTSPVGGEEEDLYNITLEVDRESGEIASWKRVNRRFLNLIRKQLLIWRTFGADVRGEFHERGRQEEIENQSITSNAEDNSGTTLTPATAT